MDCYGSLCTLTDVEELPDYGVIGGAPVHKEHVVMFKARVCEPSGIVHLFVESDNGGDVILPEVWDVSLRSMERVPLRKKGTMVTSGVLK